MSSVPLLCLSGWAHGPNVFEELCANLGQDFKAECLGLHEFMHAGVQGLGPALAKYAGRQRPVLVGYSAGGLAALEACRDFPRAAQALILIASTARFVQDRDYPYGVPLRKLLKLREEIQTNREIALSKFYQAVSYPQDLPDSELKSRLNEGLGIPLAALLSGLDYLAQVDLRTALGDINLPVLILHGQDDAVIKCENAQCLRQSLPHSRSSFFPGKGHALLSCCAKELAAEIGAFLRDGLP
jgi:pimeloyl-[acyl-carrier protein] methyl ester esterase